MVTEAGLQRLRTFLSEVPADRFPARLEGGGHSATVHGGDLLQAGGTRAAGRRHGRVSLPLRRFDVRTLPGLLLRRSHHQPGGWKAWSGPLSGPCSGPALLVLPGDRIRRPARGLGDDGRARLSFAPRRRRGGGREVRSGGAPRPDARPARRDPQLRRGSRRLQRMGPRRWRAGRGDRAQRGPDVAERRVRQPRSDARALRVAVRSGRARRTVRRRPRARSSRSPSWFQVERVRALLQVPQRGGVLLRSLPAPPGVPGNHAAGRADPDVAAGCGRRRRSGRRAHSSPPPRCRR